MPISEAARNVIEHATSVAKLEVELKALELKTKAASFAIGIGLGVGAAVAAFFALAFALATVAAAFATFLPWWLALLIVTLVLLCLCGLLSLLATRAFKKSERELMARTPDDVRKELDTERKELAAAIAELRASIGRTAKKTVPVAAGATALMGVARHLVRRRRR